jgi:hypothetical protein
VEINGIINLTESRKEELNGKDNKNPTDWIGWDF